MQITHKALYADTHPEELISRVQSKLFFFNSFLIANNAKETGGVNLEHPEISDGIYWLLDGMACELGYALDKMMEVRS